MDIDTTGYVISAGEESAERYQLEEHGFRTSGPIVIDGINIGFLAVTFDEEMNVEQATVVVVTEAD